VAAKVNFLTSDKYVEPIGPPDTDGVISIDIQVDIYSDGKEDWLTSTDLNKMKFPVRPIGGQTIAAGQLGTTYLFINGWKIKPYEGTHTFNLSGNAYADDGLPLVVNTYATDVNIRVNQNVTLSPPGLGMTIEQSSWLNDILKLAINRQTLSSDGTLTVYDDDDTSILYQQTLTNFMGNPIMISTDVPARRSQA